MGQLALRIYPGSKKAGIFLPSNRVAATLHRSSVANEAAFAVRLCEPARDNRANIALIKYLRRLTGLDVRIAAGASNRIKIVEFDATPQDFAARLRVAARSSE